ncbi:GNAT family N-acetyltransferase [Peribacillus castrilensis]|uniref:GNAT family acetyltransferase n=1 Tax=Peribacillus simplex TaxID=1478 RepID=A0AAN2PKS5_9BACI|nr:MULTISPECIES: GNAT family N-acetyltransferase [Bacillaceae]MCP1096462.1 GNAT family N-acetyltransferase [Bacillaceae bacterium OS4b]MBD8589709.1 GNAT family N-acetyltransferase [Peribacillus simplex]MCF7624197.1 GNAT family N-acetyltransferase [Peribacillus frigoritolerans]MCP1154757.1 GNAT family N-acetyltransferase [Peribacillus frigoritolerans]MCT1388363.1 GNAT family N-acetyltransferase [Peribacillus frigoritolerans]
MNSNGFSISTNKKYLDVDVIHDFLNQEAYWSKGITKETVIKSIENTTLCFGVYKGEIGNEGCDQVGFARVITDLTTHAYLCDVFILPDYRKLGLSKWLMDVITNHSELKEVRRFMLATNDAHSLYEKYGFNPIDKPELFMQKVGKTPFQQ